MGLGTTAIAALKKAAAPVIRLLGGKPATGPDPTLTRMFHERLRVLATTVPIRFLPHLNTMTGETQEMRLAYREMLGDPYVKSAVFTKVWAVASQDMRVKPAPVATITGPDGKQDVEATKDAKSAAAERAKQDQHCLDRCKGGFATLAWSILVGALVEGRSLNEPILELEDRGDYKGRLVILRDFKDKDPETYYFEIDPFLNIIGIYSRRGPLLEKYDPAEFVIYINYQIYRHPAGMADLRGAYRGWWKLDVIGKLRMIALDKHTGPFIKANYSDESIRASLEAALKQARADGFITLPPGNDVEILDLLPRGTSDFSSAEADAQREVIVGIQGAFLQQLEGQTPGGAGNSEVHQTTAELFQWAMATAVKNVLNEQVMPRLTAINHGTDVEPNLVVLGSVNAQALLAELQVDQGMQQMGYPLSMAEGYERYNRTPPTDPADTLQPTHVAAATLPGADQMDGTVSALDAAQTHPNDVNAGAAGGSGDAASGLRATVGGSTAIADLQKSYYAGEMPREAAVANAQLIFGFAADEAEKLFPQTAPTKLTSDDSSGPAPKPVGGPAAVPFDDAGRATAATAQADRPAPRRVLPVPTPAHSGDAALSGPDGAKVRDLLRGSTHALTAKLADVTATAARRLIANPTAALRAQRLFSHEEMADLADTFSAVIATGDLLGRSRVRLRQRAAIAAAGKQKFSDRDAPWESFADAVEPMPPAQALSYFRGLVPELSGDAKRFTSAMERQAFTCAKAADDTMLGKLKDVIRNALEGGETLKTSERAIGKLLDDAGVSSANPQYPEMVARTNLMDSYNAGAWRELQDPDVQDTFPAWKYSGIADGRERHRHAVHFGRYFPNTATFADVRDSVAGQFDGYNCRCSFIPIDKWEWAELQSKGATLSGI